MRCEELRSHVTDDLTHALTPAMAAEVAAHLESCPACRAEADGLRDLWQRLGDIPAEPLDSAAARSRFDAMLAHHQADSAAAEPPADRDRDLRRHTWLSPYPYLAAAATLLLGIAIGRQTASGPVADPQLAALREELSATRQMVTLSLMQQTSASERLKGVSWSGRLDSPGHEIVAALLDTLMHDANVNVRLASIDALKRFADDEKVRRAAVHELDTQTSPLVQVALIDFVVETRESEALETLRRLSRDEKANEAVRSRAQWGIDHLEAI